MSQISRASLFTIAAVKAPWFAAASTAVRSGGALITTFGRS